MCAKLLGMPIIKLQKHIGCRNYALPRFRVYGIPIAPKWCHIFLAPTNAIELRQQILRHENLHNTNVEMRLYVKQNGTWGLLCETHTLTADNLFVPYIIVMKSASYKTQSDVMLRDQLSSSFPTTPFSEPLL